MHILPTILTPRNSYVLNCSNTHTSNFEHKDDYYIEDENAFIKHDNLK